MQSHHQKRPKRGFPVAPQHSPPAQPCTVLPGTPRGKARRRAVASGRPRCLLPAPCFLTLSSAASRSPGTRRISLSSSVAQPRFASPRRSQAGAPGSRCASGQGSPQHRGPAPRLTSLCPSKESLSVRSPFDSSIFAKHPTHPRSVAGRQLAADHAQPGDAAVSSISSHATATSAQRETQPPLQH